MAQGLTTGGYGLKESLAKRRSDRILAPVRIHVSGEEAPGRTFEENAITVNINKHGAAISLTHLLFSEQRLRIRNLENGIEADFRVVGELRRVFGDRREWGVEVANPESQIWGLDFGPPPESVQPKALIACVECKTALLAPISSIEYDVLLHTGAISRHCKGCEQTTRWKPGEQAAAAGELVTGLEAPRPAVERRKHPRRRVTMLLQVRDQGGKTESVQTVDASKGGISFVSSSVFRVGEEVWFTLPFTTGDAPTESKGRIVRCESGPRGQLYAVSFEEVQTGERAKLPQTKLRFWASLPRRASSYGRRLLSRRHSH